MKVLMLFILLFSIPNDTIRLDKYYDGEGVIFDEHIHYPFVEKSYQKAYTPTKTEIENAEKFISENYYRYKQNILDSFNIKKYKIDTKYKKPEKVIKKYYTYNRQYAGFINTSGEKNIYIGMFNFAKTKEANQYFEGWKEKIFLGNHGFYDKNQDNFLINISKNEFVYKLIVNK
jgi:hypothetical protein